MCSGGQYGSRFLLIELALADHFMNRIGTSAAGTDDHAVAQPSAGYRVSSACQERRRPHLFLRGKAGGPWPLYCRALGLGRRFSNPHACRELQAKAIFWDRMLGPAYRHGVLDAG